MCNIIIMLFLHLKIDEGFQFTSILVNSGHFFGRFLTLFLSIRCMVWKWSKWKKEMFPISIRLAPIDHFQKTEYPRLAEILHLSLIVILNKLIIYLSKWWLSDQPFQILCLILYYHLSNFKLKWNDFCNVHYKVEQFYFVFSSKRFLRSHWGK